MEHYYSGSLSSLYMAHSCQITMTLCYAVAQMPDRPTWIDRSAEILAWLESEAPPFLHRGLVEAAFRLRRRQALRLMAQAGGYQAGRTYLIDRDQLAGFLRTRDSGVVAQAVQRKVRLQEKVDEARRQIEAQRVRVRVEPDLGRPGTWLAGLPAGIECVAQDRLQISFFGPEDLISKVASLAAFAVQEPVRFREMFEPEAKREPAV